MPSSGQSEGGRCGPANASRSFPTAWISRGIVHAALAGSEQARQPVILFVGFLIQRKGVRYLLDAAPAILARNPVYRIVLVGRGSRRAVLCASRLLPWASLDAVEFAGFLGTTLTCGVWMQQARYAGAAITGRRPGGRAPLEALAGGISAAGSDVEHQHQRGRHSGGRPAAVSGGGDGPGAGGAGLRFDRQTRQTGSGPVRRPASVALEVYDWNVLARRFLRCTQRQWPQRRSGSEQP